MSSGPCSMTPRNKTNLIPFGSPSSARSSVCALFLGIRFQYCTPPIRNTTSYLQSKPFKWLEAIPNGRGGRGMLFIGASCAAPSCSLVSICTESVIPPPGKSKPEISIYHVCPPVKVM